MKTCPPALLVITFLSALFFYCPISAACDIAVVSTKASLNGRPFIWKSRDNGLGWEQEVAAYKRRGNTVNSEAGGSVRVIDRTRVIPAQSGGVNEAGFAITNTTVYQESPIHEYLASANLNVMSVALKECVTVEDFDNYLTAWHERGSNATRIISGNFVVIDAYGGATLYELTTGDNQYDVYAYGGRLKIHKIDANTGFVTNEDGELIGNMGEIGYITGLGVGAVEKIMDDDRTLIVRDYSLADYGTIIVDEVGTIIDDGGNFEGFVNRTNSSFWVKLYDDTPREDRAREMMRQLKYEDRLNYRTMIQEVARDIDIDSYYLETYPGLSNLDPGTETEQSTFHTISRYSTNLAFVVDGVKPDDNPELTTMWISLGEPSFSVATPYFAASNRAPELSWADTLLFNIFPLDLKPMCFLNMAFQDLKAEMYDLSNEETFIFPIAEITTQALLSLIAVDWCGQFYEEAWSDYEQSLSEWHLAYLENLATEDTTDKTIRMDIYYSHMSWIQPLEDIIMDQTEFYLDTLRNDPSAIDSDKLFELSDYCAEFAYNNIIHRSASYETWDFEADNSYYPFLFWLFSKALK